jgi:hypothetical protein
MDNWRSRSRTLARTARSSVSDLLRLSDHRGERLAQELIDRRLTFLKPEPLLDLRRRARELEKAEVPGAFVEAGCALGGSAIMLAASKRRARPLEVYDVFGLIPPPSDRDDADVHKRYEVIASGKAKGFGGDPYYGYQPDLKQRVADSFAEFGYPLEENNVALIEGLFEDTLRPSGPAALAHVDGDWYESVKVCLERLWPALSPGGVVVIDDYDAWSGCRTAVDEFVAAASDVQLERRSRLHLVKRS